MFAETFIAIGILVVMAQRKLFKHFYFVAIYLGLFVIENAVSISMLFFRAEIGLSKLLAYNILFFTRWPSLGVLSVLTLLIIQSNFSSAMKPMKGLHRVGKMIFRWIFAVSFVVCIGIALGSHVSMKLYYQNLFSQIQQATSILTLCLLLFVCFSIRHLGMTYRSHIFGISLGLGVMATVCLINSAFYTIAEAQPLYSPVCLYSALGSCCALLVWGVYFALPEPAAKMVLLPTTSPYFLWNSISEALGDDPGHVAIAGFKPTMLAPAELQVLSMQGGANRRLQEHTLSAAPALEAPASPSENVRPAFAIQA